MIKWYLEIGLKITRIIEFAPKLVLNLLVRLYRMHDVNVTDDHSKAIVADTMKLVGNSPYTEKPYRKAIEMSCRKRKPRD